MANGRVIAGSRGWQWGFVAAARSVGRGGWPGLLRNVSGPRTRIVTKSLAEVPKRPGTIRLEKPAALYLIRRIGTNHVPPGASPSNPQHKTPGIEAAVSASGLYSPSPLENLKASQRPEPEAGPGRAVVRIRAVSLNFRDLMMVRGHYNPKQPLPLIPCSDGVGEVVAVGEGVNRIQVGQRVAGGTFSQSWIAGPPDAAKLRMTLGGPVDGMLAEKVLLDAEGLVPLPEYLSDVEAACLPCAALTAWSALVEQGNVRAGESVLILGSGGVSVFALQIARMLGAEVIATSSSEEKRRRLEELGASATINYAENPKWSRTVRELTGGRGVDHVVEVGGAGTLEQSLRSVRTGGTVSVIGVLSGISSSLNIIPILMQQLRLQGILVGSREGFERMNRAFEMHRLQASHFGKVCISLD